MDELYTVYQAALTLKVHPLTIRRYVKEGKLKALRVGGNVRISAEDLQIFIEGFVPHPKANNSSLPKKEPFSFSDPLFRLKAKGLGINKF